jgi:hypothetical protein
LFWELNRGLFLLHVLDFQIIKSCTSFCCLSGSRGDNMGLLFSRIWDRFVGKSDQRMLMVGLDAAGKTTILYKLKLGEVVNTIPTIGFNVETVEYKNICFTVW